MADIDRRFVAWEEHIVCADRGNRMVHYYLKNVAGELVLAVIGTERSIRHMTYVVADQFVEGYGSCVDFSGGLKWRARRDAVEWLASLVSDNAEALDNSNMMAQDSVRASGSFEVPASSSKSHQTSYLMTQRKVKPHNQNLDWYGKAWLCAKQLKHYQAFCSTDTIVAVHSFVFISAEEECTYLGYVEDMYEDKRGQKKIKVRWFHYGEEVKGVIPDLNLAPREVMITSHVQVISAQCFNCPAIVLTPSHYEKCLEVVPEPSTLGIYMCFRQFNNNRIKSFCLAKLRGYANQAILPCLDDSEVDRDRVKSSKLNISEEGKSTSVNMSQVGIKRKRTGKGSQGPEVGLSKNLMGTYFKLPQPPCSSAFRVGDKIELLSHDSGIRGCWFRCEILQVSHKNLKVQYDDLEDAEGCGNLEEWVSTHRVAAPDKLGMRCSGRLTIRPRPLDDSRDCFFYIGSPIDAWWCDGWWEGVIIGHGTNTLSVFLPGENNFLVLQRKHIRSSRDWIGNRWIAVKAKLDIIHYISSNVIPGTKPSLHFNLIRVPGRCSLVLTKHESHTDFGLRAIEEVESEGPLEVPWVTQDKRSCKHDGRINHSSEAAPVNMNRPILADDFVNSANNQQMCGNENEGPIEAARATEIKRSCECMEVNQSGEEATLNMDKSALAADIVYSSNQGGQSDGQTNQDGQGDGQTNQDGQRATEFKRSCECEQVNQSGEEATLNLDKSVFAVDIVHSTNRDGRSDGTDQGLS